MLWLYGLLCLARTVEDVAPWLFRESNYLKRLSLLVHINDLLSLLRTVCLVLTKVGYKSGGTNERYTGKKARDETISKRERHLDEIGCRLGNEDWPREVETNVLLRD